MLKSIRFLHNGKIFYDTSNGMIKNRNNAYILL